MPRSGGGTGRRIADALLAPLHLILPIALLIATSAAVFLYTDMPVAWLGDETAKWLTLGHLLIPLTFLAIHITNRRYGAGYALTQVIGAWALGAAAVWSERADLAGLIHHPLPMMREVLAFGGALFLGQIFAVLVFDRTRGPRWWQAPLFASLWGSVIFCLLAFPAAYAGSSIDWIGEMTTYLGIMIGASIAMLIPYWAIRGIVPPMSGFGGY